MSDLVREAIEAQYGKEIETASSFFAQNGYDVIHEDNELSRSDGPGAA